VTSPDSLNQVVKESIKAHLPTTHRSRIITGDDDGTPAARAAIAQLCEAYWYPIFVLIRRRVNSPEKTWYGCGNGIWSLQETRDSGFIESG
jgi:hypothetical protein